MKHTHELMKEFLLKTITAEEHKITNLSSP